MGISALCTLATAATVTLAPITAQPQRNTVDWFSWKIQVTERTLDGTIACDINRTRSVDKEAYPRMTAEQQRVALEKAAFDKKRSRHASATHCKNDSRVKAAGAFTECELELRMKKTVETASGTILK